MASRGSNLEPDTKISPNLGKAKKFEFNHTLRNPRRLKRHMKVYISCDIEGTAGVVDHKTQCRLVGEHYTQARRMTTMELNALAEGALEAGASRVVAWNGHCQFPGCIDVEILHPEVELIMGAGDGGPVMLTEEFDALLQVGLHSMEGTPGGVMAHSGFRLNGVDYGEIGITAVIAGMRGVPCVFVSGDWAACLEAEALIPGVTTVSVKQGLFSDVRGLEQSPTLTLSPEKARRLIKEKTVEALGKVDEITPLKVDGPFRFGMYFMDRKWAEGLQQAYPDAEWVDGNWLEVTRDSFWDLPF